MAKSKDHDQILHQFREQLVQQDLIHDGDTIGTDDATLLRFLRARHFDVKQATAMWSNCQEWRSTVEGVGIDELYKQLDPFDYPERDKVFECWPLWFHKTDKQGRPLNIHSFGGINMPELYKHVTPERFWKTIVVNCESLTREVLPASARAAAHAVHGTFVIVDLKGFGIGQFWQMKNLARDCFQVSQDYYPETMAQLAIVNAPASFTTIWGFIKPWLAKETVAKVDVLGANFADVLLRQIDADSLPQVLGGRCTCAEHGGCSMSNAGPWVDGRKERREQWLRGERATPSDSEDEDAAPEPEDEEQWEDALEKQEKIGAGAYGKESAVVDAGGGVDRQVTEPEPEPETESTPSSSSSPSTPGTDDEARSSLSRMALDGAGDVREKSTPQESAQAVYEHHPDTSLPLTGDLHKDTDQ
ncbi:CRAL/TRIO domain-containing protein [Amylocystis lapponica]|nr:CRAL/TRIO domain-containing protein [Amylocystis lapponica]